MSAETPPQVEADLDAIAPAEVNLARSAQMPPDEAPPAQNRPPLPVLAGVGVLLVLALVVVFVLPSLVDDASTADQRIQDITEGPPPITAEAGDASAATADDGAVAPFEAMELERERLAAQEILEQMLARVETLEGRAVELWGAEALAEGRAMAEAGDDAFLTQEYEAAQTLYADALSALDALIAHGETLYAAQLTAARAAIEAGDVSAAMAAMEFVRAVDPERPETERAWARASVLEEVLDLVGESRAVASDGAIKAARSLVAEALSLDADSAPARALAGELDGQLARADFLKDMSAGYAALGAGRFDDAEAAFARAEAREPGAAEVIEGRRILAAEQFAVRIAALRTTGEAAEARSAWEAAAEAYAEAVSLDATLAFAREGLARSQQRAALDIALSATLAAPEELNQPGELDAARALLTQARATPEPDARLNEQIDALDETLRLAVIPVAVNLTSDGFTDVRLLRIRSLGRFVDQRLELLPGRYVATGARIGYRDVRIEFIVTPTGTGTPVTIRCTTRI